MARMIYNDDTNIRSIDRSPYRNMPSSCEHCGYRNRPSSSGVNCSTCCLKIRQDGGEVK